MILVKKIIFTSLEESFGWLLDFKFAVESAVEVKSSAAAGEGDDDSGRGLVENGGIDVVGNAGNCVHLCVDEVVLAETLNRGEVHAAGLIDGVVAGVV